MGNEAADVLAKSGSLQRSQYPNYKSQAYVAALHRRELQEAWKLRWTNTPNTPKLRLPTSQQTHPEIPNVRSTALYNATRATHTWENITGSSSQWRNKAANAAKHSERTRHQGVQVLHETETRPRTWENGKTNANGNDKRHPWSLQEGERRVGVFSDHVTAP